MGNDVLALREELERKYPRKIIAICEGEVVATSDDYHEAFAEARKKVGKKKITITRLGPPEDKVLLF
ncbi:MAG: DUF5678 domain-containing protein [Methanocellales archaeon]|nr:DUF5678 domain-containing protein [Methanocellales archaeon]